jgi:hypothetical protein
MAKAVIELKGQLPIESVAPSIFASTAPSLSGGEKRWPRQIWWLCLTDSMGRLNSDHLSCLPLCLTTGKWAPYNCGGQRAGTGRLREDGKRPKMEPYRDHLKSSEVRVKDLPGRMTLSESWRGPLPPIFYWKANPGCRVAPEPDKE